MFARIVNIPSASTMAYTEACDKQDLPLNLKHRGFAEQICLITADGKTGFRISFCDNKESAEAYRRSGYSEVTKSLDAVDVGLVQIQLCQVTNSTVHKIAAALAA